MKKFLMILLVAGLVAGNQGWAQHGSGNGKGNGSGNGKGGNNTEKTGKDNSQAGNKGNANGNNADKTNGNGKDKENQGQGNAYGKDKGGLEGRDFGQNRAMEARNKKEAVEQADANISQTEQTNQNTKDLIKQAREKLEAKKKANQISPADYTTTKNALDDLEKQVTEVEKQNQELKTRLETEKQTKKE